ncbi:hypothetical protein SAMN02745172_02484 [Pseudoxanthobacter soli DSM 19599]|uniref:Uncharacterized protein n=1 Tax=Pseudoxanthobacter soli DSM 19599 TaxID=1123029 RepID=A0A1M7ZLS2_9HYPH|nr:hypothetical protein [Pseudoxanthobacter soli]SHO65837.1 hypothetical protein SAMN02745172_02484 [Pseudoxanthobacter soli DSM 19599]
MTAVLAWLAVACGAVVLGAVLSILFGLVVVVRGVVAGAPLVRVYPVPFAAIVFVGRPPVIANDGTNFEVRR